MRAFVSEIAIEKGTVLDGIGVQKGATVDLVAFDGPLETPLARGSAGFNARPKFTPGQRYLALSVASEGERLFQPDSLIEPGYLKMGHFIAATKPEEVALLAAFPTQAATLPNTGSASDRVLGALVDALPAAQGWHRERLLYFLENSNGFGYDKYDPHGESAVTRKLSDMAARTNDPVVRADAFAVLVSWCVTGSEGPFFNALLDAADSPRLTGDLPENPFFVRPGTPGHPGPDYKIEYDRPSANRLAALAKNGEVRRYLFEFAVSDPTPADKALYVRMLETEDKDFVDRVMLRRLAKWEGRKDKAPVMGVPAGKKAQECVNRDQLISFWKSKYRG